MKAIIRGLSLELVQVSHPYKKIENTRDRGKRIFVLRVIQICDFPHVCQLVDAERPRAILLTSLFEPVSTNSLYIVVERL